MVSVPVEEAGQRKINLSEDHPGGKQRQQVHSVPVVITEAIKILLRNKQMESM